MKQERYYYNEDSRPPDKKIHGLFTRRKYGDWDRILIYGNQNKLQTQSRELSIVSLYLRNILRDKVK